MTVNVRFSRRFLSERYVYFPGRSRSVHVALAFALIPVFRFTPGPVRWKFCLLDESVTVSL